MPGRSPSVLDGMDLTDAQWEILERCFVTADAPMDAACLLKTPCSQEPED